MPDDFAGGAVALREAGELVVDVDGFEGPLDLLLSLARSQKVDLRRISVLQLAEQYLAFVAVARARRIELAADYLVMAAWLAYLKSRLLLPDPDGEGPDGAELAAHLAWQLERLAAMRRAAAELMARDRLGRDRFARGMTETLTVTRRTVWEASLAELLAAYARVRTRDAYAPLSLDRGAVMSLEEALARLAGMVGEVPGWEVLSAFLPAGWALAPLGRRSALASTFAAMLELARRGEIEISQEAGFAPIRVRARAATVAAAAAVAEACA